MRVLPATLPATTGPAPGPPPAPVGVPTVRQIFVEYASFVWRTLRRLGVPDADADDLCQDVFVVVHRKLGDFQAQSSLRTWLYGICIRTAAEHRRLARVRLEQLTGAVPEQSVPPGQHRALEQRQAITL